MRGPGIDADLAADPAHEQAAHPRPLPDRLELGRRREDRAQAHLESHRGDFAGAEIGDRLLHALNPPAQAVHGRVDRLQHGRGQRHVGADEQARRVEVDLVLGEQERQADEHVRLRRNVDVEQATGGLGHVLGLTSGGEPGW